ncbi:baseplate hub assembly catalyst [Sinorhizobium phage phiM9]|uniref:Putative baseplate hub assembly catalyst n=1 Tax=Sinorhizobium phage phiM9 TaxID=1636182 RepID=A0A0F6R4W3_9CAUD|nr:baseplate hub assembly catalyst [Sinorhizobium phage phiM9]AKE44682.1 putative baseplate hub assembly catalyst [Sinorhizobium phage phiM9]
MLSHATLVSHMKINFSMKLMRDMNWSVEELENMTPFERDVYLLMCQDHVKQMKAKMKNA